MGMNAGVDRDWEDSQQGRPASDSFREGERKSGEGIRRASFLVRTRAETRSSTGRAGTAGAK